MDRPPVPTWSGSPPAEAWEVVEDGPGWTAERIVVARVGDRQGCRFIVDRRGCAEPIVAVLYRGRAPGRPYGYCGRHLYGRWIEDGRVVGWRARKEAPWRS